MRGRPRARASREPRPPRPDRGESVARDLHQALRRSCVWIRLLPQHDPLNLIAGALDQLGDLLLALAEVSQHPGRDDLGVGRVRAPDADADACEIGSAELALERLQPVVAGEPTADSRADLTEGKVDLVIHD